MRMDACDMVFVVVVVEWCRVNDCVVTGGSVEMSVVRVPWLVVL